MTTESLLVLLGGACVVAPAALAALVGVATVAGRPLSERATAGAVSAVSVVGLAAAVAVFVGMLATGTRHVAVDLGDWVHADGGGAHYGFDVSFVFDRLSVPFVALTFLLCGTIGQFAQRYLHREPGYDRFFVLYSLFLLGMAVAALAGSVETLLVGWELVGLSSVFLIAFFQERPSPPRNGLRVWVVYRAADCGLLLAVALLHHAAGTGEFARVFGPDPWPGGTTLNSPAPSAPAERLLDPPAPSAPAERAWGLAPGVNLAVGAGLLLAAAGKSALVPFSGWLPRAMEGPTPSSAVFYGALSVHLGAYLLLRCGPVFDASPTLSAAALGLGLVTAATAALAGRVQTDVKSALSYASLTQVGLIVAEIGLGWRYVPLVHLLGHACLRTLQFVRAPSVIRDVRVIENAVGARLPPSPAVAADSKWPWLYRLGLERGYLDAALDRFVAGPFVRLFRWLDRADRGATDRFGGPRPDPAKPPA